MALADDSDEAALFISDEEKAALKEAGPAKDSSSDVDLNSIVGLARALEIAERAVVQNTFHDRVKKITRWLLTS